MTFSRVRTSAVALFVAVVAGACGAADELSGAKAGYVAQVDPICAELQASLGELGEDAARQAGELERAVERIREVSVPNEDSALANRFVAAMENLWLSVLDLEQSRLVGDQARADEALSRAQENSRIAADAADDYGMVVCAQEL